MLVYHYLYPNVYISFQFYLQFKYLIDQKGTKWAVDFFFRIRIELIITKPQSSKSVHTFIVVFCTWLTILSIELLLLLCDASLGEKSHCRIRTFNWTMQYRIQLSLIPMIMDTFKHMNKVIQKRHIFSSNINSITNFFGDIVIKVLGFVHILTKQHAQQKRTRFMSTAVRW